MKRLRKISRKVHKTSCIAAVAGIGYEVVPELQGILPAWWYICAFVGIAILHYFTTDDNE